MPVCAGEVLGEAARLRPAAARANGCVALAGSTVGRRGFGAGVFAGGAAFTT
jgi:hypothetical protein